MAGNIRIRRGLGVVLAALVIGVVGCTTAPGADPGKQLRNPSPAPSVEYVPTNTTLDFSGSAPAPFEDPTTTEERFSGRFAAGRWLTVNNTYRQTQEVQTATLMFQRYNGNGFGLEDGQAPSRYSVELTAFAYRPVTATESVIAGAPAGVIGFIPYYLDSTHYIIVERVKDQYEVWFVDGLTPGDEWAAETYRKFDMTATASLAVNEPITFKTEIDTKRGTMRLWINGEYQAQLTDTNFIRDVQHSFALLSNGNFAAFRDVKLSGISN